MPAYLGNLHTHVALALGALAIVIGVAAGPGLMRLVADVARAQPIVEARR
jgi:hypothetical protein